MANKGIKKIIVAICMCLMTSSVFGAIKQPTIPNIEKEKQINTQADFDEVEKALLEAIKLGDTSKYFIIGSLYLEDYSFRKKNVLKAKMYLNKALQEGYGLAALPLSHMSLESGNIDEALMILDNGITMSEKDINSQVIMSVLFNGIILDSKYKDMRYVHKALDLTYPVSQKINKSALDFTVANLLNIAGNIEEAKKYLNTACNNPEVDAEILEVCRKSAGITNNIKKSKECSTCGILK